MSVFKNFEQGKMLHFMIAVKRYNFMTKCVIHDSK